MQKPTPGQLAHAHAKADLRGTLAEAMRSPLLARCLEITAQALARPRAGQLRPPSAAPPGSPALQAPNQHKNQCRDFKRASAADKDDF